MSTPETGQVTQANASGRGPVVFIHGLWAALFEEAGYAPVSPGWPGTPPFQAAPANFNPQTEARVDTRHPDRGHAPTIDSGRAQVAPTAPDFIRRFT
jgi:hypothetical protein